MEKVAWFTVVGVLLLCSLNARPDEGLRTVLEWTFDTAGDLQGWQPNGQAADCRVADGILSGHTTGGDPFLSSATFEVAARPWQAIELRIKTDQAGHGEIFWSGTTEGQFGGFSQEKSTPFAMPGGGEWQTILVRPFWHTEGKIVHLRLDLADGQSFAIDRIRIVEPANQAVGVNQDQWSFGGGLGDWDLVDLPPAATAQGGLTVKVDDGKGFLRSPMLDVPIGDRMWVILRMRTEQGTRASLLWATEGTVGLHEMDFPVRSDGRVHTYNLDVGGDTTWDGKLLALGLKPSHTPGDTAWIESLALSAEPQGPPDLELVHLGLSDAIARVGKPTEVVAKFINHGAETARGLTAELVLPDGVTLVAGDKQQVDCEFQCPAEFHFQVTADRELAGTAAVRIHGPGAPDRTFSAPIAFSRGPELPHTGYVPEPRPAQSTYQIGSYYFPRWYRSVDWECIDRVAPIRKPVLGWYDESNPEVVDWQIKWAVEHGVTYFLVDWYWSAGSRSLEQWLHQGYLNAKYRRYLKWAVMWANHNAPGTHSVEDWRNVTQYWIDHYFGMEEYQRLDGKPAVYIWAPGNLRRDLGGSEDAAKMLAMSQEMAKAAGYPGITFVAMNDGGTPDSAKRCAAEGYASHTHYHHWADAPQQAADPRHFPYSLVVDRSYQGWVQRDTAVRDAGMTYLPVADSGWDSRPWHGDKSMVIYDRTADQFERLLREAKRFLDEHHETNLVLGPWNEWGEGSYLEPCAEYGFGMLDAIRKVFCTGPEVRTDVIPADVGLGPYDVDMSPANAGTSWTFDAGTNGWDRMMGMSEVTSVDGALHTVTTSPDPAFASPILQLHASLWPYLVIRMKVVRPQPGADACQMFFATATRTISEANSVKAAVNADGQWHTYVLAMHENPRWRGVVTSFRFDPVSTKDAEVWIDDIHLAKEPPAGG